MLLGVISNLPDMLTNGLEQSNSNSISARPAFGPFWPSSIIIDSLSNSKLIDWLHTSTKLQWRRRYPPCSATPTAVSASRGSTVDAAWVSYFSPHRSPRLRFPAVSTAERHGRSGGLFLSLSPPEASPNPISPSRRAQASATSSLKLLSPPPKPSPSELHIIYFELLSLFFCIIRFIDLGLCNGIWLYIMFKLMGLSFWIKGGVYDLSAQHAVHC